MEITTGFPLSEFCLTLSTDSAALSDIYQETEKELQDRDEFVTSLNAGW